MDGEFEVLAFPYLFPTDIGSFHPSVGRLTKLTSQQYYQQCLLEVDKCFSKNIEYLFCAQYAADLKQFQGDTNLAL